MNQLLFRALAVAFDLLMLLVSGRAYRGHGGSELFDFSLQVTVLTWLCGGLSVLLFLSRESGEFRVVLALLRALVFSVLVAILPVLDTRAIPLSLGFTLVLALHVPTGFFLAFEAVWFAVALLIILAFPDLALRVAAGGAESLLFLACASAILFCALMLRIAADRLGKARRESRHLEEEIGLLSKANLGFQQFASQLELESTQAERLRLSREIHDSAGYSLTTLKMLFEAAKGLISKDPSRLGSLMDVGAGISQDALNEIRGVLHTLRRRTEGAEQGMAFIVQLARNFEAACGIKVRLEIANSQGSFPQRVYSVLFRMVQEGLTNAFHHGHATEVEIHISEAEGLLRVKIRDNGTGSPSIEKGIGLSGMEERVAEIGGSMQYGTRKHGFEIMASLPIKESS